MLFSNTTFFEQFLREQGDHVTVRVVHPAIAGTKAPSLVTTVIRMLCDAAGQSSRWLVLDGPVHGSLLPLIAGLSSGQQV